MHNYQRLSHVSTVNFYSLTSHVRFGDILTVRQVGTPLLSVLASAAEAEESPSAFPRPNLPISVVAVSDSAAGRSPSHFSRPCRYQKQQLPIQRVSLFSVGFVGALPDTQILHCIVSIYDDDGLRCVSPPELLSSGLHKERPASLATEDVQLSTKFQIISSTKQQYYYC